MSCYTMLRSSTGLVCTLVGRSGRLVHSGRKEYRAGLKRGRKECGGRYTEIRRSFDFVYSGGKAYGTGLHWGGRSIGLVYNG